MFRAGSPSVLVGGLSAQVVAAADEPGRLFFVVVAADATAPTAAEVLAGTAAGRACQTLLKISFNTFANPRFLTSIPPASCFEHFLPSPTHSGSGGAGLVIADRPIHVRAR